MEEMTNIMFDKYNDKYHVLDPLGVQWRDGSPSIWSRGTRRRGTSAQPLSDDDHDDDHNHGDDDGVHHDHGFLNTKLHIDHRELHTRAICHETRLIVQQVMFQSLKKGVDIWKRCPNGS